jgi:hypothetical protein
VVLAVTGSVAMKKRAENRRAAPQVKPRWRVALRIDQIKTVEMTAKPAQHSGRNPPIGSFRVHQPQTAEQKS